MHDLGPGDRLDQYVITGILTRSGMASVLKATDTASGQPVALKIPHEHLECDVAFYERFRREMEIGRCLDHPNVVRFLTPRDRSRVYLAMEYLDGESLRVLMGRGRLPLDQALDIARQIGAALVHLHGNGVVHRDLKPENVYLVTPGRRVKLLDFGIALLDSARRMTWAGLSRTLGTPDYMAPEQIRGRRGDARTDVYALGTILYELLSGHLPYEAANVAVLLHAKTRRPARGLREHVPAVPASLESVVLRALALDPRERYPSAQALVDRLSPPWTATADAERAAAARGSFWSRTHRLLSRVVQSSPRDSTLAASELRYLARTLGHSPTRKDAPLLPGIDVSDLGG